MKTKVLATLVGALLALQLPAQTFQKSVTTNDQRHFHDLNIAPAIDGTDDFFVAGNLFDASMQLYTPVLQRVDASGSVIWQQTYAASLPNARFFDIEPYQINGLPFEVAITGSIDVNGVKNVFIAKVDAGSGMLVNARHYAIPNPSFHSRGLHITYVFNDADGDGFNDEGFVVGGINSDSYALSKNAANAGFVLRVYGTLGVFWVVHTNSPSGNDDLDAVNHVTETSDGYFLTGSSNDSASGQLTVLAQKIDFQGNPVWNKSHFYGNAQDISVDAYYEAATDKIYMLSNYSVSHLFGVTVLDNITGNINNAQSWVATSNELDRYGFTILESLQNSNNLVITGYDRDETWTGSSGTSYSGQSNIFVYEFEKSTGNPVSLNYQYLVTHAEPAGDEFNFWNAQLPLVYYPDISFGDTDVNGVAYYKHIGYYSETPGSSFTQADLFRTLPDKINECDKVDITINPIPLSADFAVSTAAFSDALDTPIQFTPIEVPNFSRNCTPTLAIGENQLEGIKFYPNPAYDFVYTTMKETTSYTIFDNMGRSVRSGEISEIRPIYIGDLESGIYFITLGNGEHMRSPFKLLKE